MRRLFVMDNDGELDLNKEWLHMIPEFSIILHRVWKCEGDADGRKKTMQKKIFKYIWLTIDYASPLFTWQKDARCLEAMAQQNLKSGDIEHPTIVAAIEYYEYLQSESVPELKALKGMYASLDKMNEFLEHIDFKAEDKQGKPKYTPSTVTRAIKDINMAYDAIATMEHRVTERLKKEGGNTIRGTATLGGMEGKRKKEWAEGAGPAGSEIQKSIEAAGDDNMIAVEGEANFRKMGAYLKNITSDDYDGTDDLEGGEDDVS